MSLSPSINGNAETNRHQMQVGRSRKKRKKKMLECTFIFPEAAPYIAKKKYRKTRERMGSVEVKKYTELLLNWMPRNFWQSEFDTVPKDKCHKFWGERPQTFRRQMAFLRDNQDSERVELNHFLRNGFLLTFLRPDRFTGQRVKGTERAFFILL